MPRSLLVPAPETQAHAPVLAPEIAEMLAPGPGDVVVDCTFGAAGHARALAEDLGPDGLYIAIDRDQAGQRAAERLSARAAEAGIGCHVLEPQLGDFNDDLRAQGAEALRQHLAEQIDLEDQHRLTI